MSTDTPPQPAHGEPWEDGPDEEIIGDCGTNVLTVHYRDGDSFVTWSDFKQKQRAIECVNKLMFHLDLSAVEVHSKETMDEVRKILEGVEAHILKSKATPEAHTPERMLSIRIHYALAKLNPPQG